MPAVCVWQSKRRIQGNEAFLQNPAHYYSVNNSTAAAATQSCNQYSSFHGNIKHFHDYALQEHAKLPAIIAPLPVYRETTQSP